MGLLKRNKFVGGRIVKTGIAVLLTSVICYLLKWPEMFAVITAIVTIEPTVHDSIKKAFIRFPASAIGAAYSVLFTFALGDTPFTYTLVALGTIITCNALRLHDGIVVATLTGVAMISTVHDQYVVSFLVRLGTTTTGLIVSSLVNLLVIRPDYSENIIINIQQLFNEVGSFLEKRGQEILSYQPLHKETTLQFRKLEKDIETIETLCKYQKEEWRYHPFTRDQVRIFHYEYKKLMALHQLIYHLGNLKALSANKLSLTEENRQVILATIDSLKAILCHQPFGIPDSHHKLVKELVKQFRDAQMEQKEQNGEQDHHIIQPEIVLLYELLAINDVLDEIKMGTVPHCAKAAGG
ncbi:aromatic acid exporter family protein [Neobacillus rhizosphaerae]|uniref:aromatic acid exporter family protein n=1 Tax=Neobacillus rhizosphaerae TaxID=2880965 RepID=UPI003D27BB75